MNQFKQNRFWFLVILFILVISTKITIAKTITLKEAVNWGFKHNYSLQEQQHEVLKIKRQLAKIKTELAWQVQLTGNTTYEEKTVVNEFTLKPQQVKEKQLQFSLSGQKVFPWGLKFKPKFNLSEKNDFNDNFEFNNLKDKFDFNLNVIQKFYPWTPIKAEKEYYSTHIDWLKAQDTLDWQKGSKKIDWLEKYLNLLILKQRLKVARKNQKLAKDRLTRILKQKQINEAGKQQVLTAKVDLKQAKLQLVRAKNKFKQRQKSWKEELNLPPDRQVALVDVTPYLKKIKKLINSLQLNFTVSNSTTKLMKKAKNNSSKFKANKLDQKLVRKQKKWDLLEQKPEVKFTGNYDYQSGDWKAGINLTHKLFDGGQNELSNRDYEKRLSLLRKKRHKIIKDLNLELKKLLDQLQQAKLNLEEKKLALQKGRLEKKAFKEQLTRGSITRRKYQQKTIDFQRVRIDLKAAKNKVLISKLRLIHFLGLKIN